MIIVEPVGLTISASSIPEPDTGEPAAWLVGTTYALDDLVRHDHVIWKSTEGSNLGNTPSASSLKWARVQSVNRYRCIDYRIASPSVETSPFTMTVVPDTTATAIVLVGIKASSVQVEIDDGGTILYDETHDLVDATQVNNWFNWTYGGVAFVDDKVIVGVPAYAGVDINITLTGDGDVELGELVVGVMHEFGTTTGADVGIDDYSVKERDDFGAATLVERDYSATVLFNVAMPKADSPRVKQILSRLRATPCVFLADGTHYGASVYGYPADWSIPLTSEDVAYMTLEVEGLT